VKRDNGNVLPIFNAAAVAAEGDLPPIDRKGANANAMSEYVSTPHQ
jgi:hypothetical protein